MNKKYILILVLIFTSVFVFSQNIDLPDITTEIDGESLKAENDSIPDFKDILELPSGSGNIVPELPDISFDNENENKEINPIKKSEKKIFSEILLAGGYPLLFQGNCSIFGVDQVNPFKILFKFNSSSGYGGQTVSNNYSDKNINLFFEKKYSKDNFKWGFSTEYNYISNGLQMKSDYMNIMNQEVITGIGTFDYDFSEVFSVGANLNLDLYNRYGNIIENKEIPNWIKRNFIFSMNPEIFGKWTGSNLAAKISFGYLGAFNSSKYMEGEGNNRGNINISLNWTNDLMQAYGDFSVVFGNQFNSSSDSGALVPFRLGADFDFPVYFSNRKVGISVEGGLHSYYNSVKELEYKYKFAALNEVPDETALWYGKLDFDVPIKSSFSANASIAYSHTAFDNGVWEPNYNDSSEASLFNGIYKIEKKNQQLLTTDLNITYHHKLFSIKGGLHSNWLDIPALEGLQMINLNVGFQNEYSKWGVNLFGEYNITENWSLPIINLDCFIQISPTIRITASFGDIIPLFTGGQRIYAGNYVDRGFTGALLLSLVL